MSQNQETYLPNYVLETIDMTKNGFVPEKTEAGRVDANAERIDWGIQLAGIPDKWKQTKGEGIKIAVLDSDMVRHGDLDEAIVCQRNFTKESDDEKSGHGTHIAGIIGARENDT